MPESLVFSCAKILFLSHFKFLYKVIQHLFQAKLVILTNTIFIVLNNNVLRNQLTHCQPLQPQNGLTLTPCKLWISIIYMEGPYRAWHTSQCPLCLSGRMLQRASQYLLLFLRRKGILGILNQLFSCIEII